jgi:hypothetical protein
VQEPTPFGTEACIDCFYGFGPPERTENISQATQVIGGAPSVVAIGQDLMGNMIWLKCDGDDAGFVYVHDHEGRSAWPDEKFYKWFPNPAPVVVQYLEMRKHGKLPRKQRGYEHIYLLARSFTEFMDSLQPEPNATNEGIPSAGDPDRIPKGIARCDDVILKELLESGKLNKEVFYGQTPVQIVAGMGNLEALHWLLAAGARIGKGALWAAAGNNNIEMVRFLIDKGCTIEERTRGMTPLMHAVEVALNPEDNIAIARILIQHGANVNAVSDDGQSVLRIAGGDRYSTGKTKGPPKLIAFLDAAGAKLNPP